MRDYEKLAQNREARHYGKKLLVYRPRVNDLRMEFEVRFDPVKGLFAAYVGHEWLTAPILPGLKKQIEEKAQELTKITWSFFIEIDEVVDKDDGNHHFSGGERERLHIEARWHLVEVSNQVPGGKHLQRRAWLTESGEPESSGYRPDEIDINDLGSLVPYTKERWQRLQELKEAANKVGARLKEILNNDGVAGFLDAGIPLLLPSSVIGEPNGKAEDGSDHQARRRRK